jgi:very-short-patch-repair endonuclease
MENKRNNSFPKVKKFVEENSDSELLETEYKNNSTKMRFRCKCGNEFKTTFQHFKDQNKTECNECSDKRRTGKFKPYTIEQVREIIKSMNCELLTNEYIKNTQKLEIRCKCGEIFTTDLATFKGKNKTRCDKCSKKQSTYARVVEYYLRKNNITFIKEYRFKNCRNILPLPFDFYLPKIKTCIEVDGELHYEPSRFSASIEDFRIGILRDSIKSDFCKKHRIKLIRIPYYEIKNKKYKERIDTLIPR